MSDPRAATRWLYNRAGQNPRRTERVLYAAVTLLCAAVFAGFFAIGHVADQGSAPSQTSSIAPVTPVPSVVPLRLSSAPPIERIVRAHVRETPAAALPASQSSSSVAAPTEAAASPSQGTPSPGTGQGTSDATPKAKVRSSGGVPFESSG
jgi:hypothetical protein